MKIELAPRRECNFHIFTSFLPEPQNHRFWELFWEPFGSLLAPIWPPGLTLGLPRASLGLPRGAFWDTYFLIDFLMPFFVKNDAKKGGGPSSKECPTLPLSSSPPTTYDGLSLLTFKPGLKSPGLSGTCMGKPWNRKAQNSVIEMSVCLPLLLCLPFLIEMDLPQPYKETT